MFDNNIMHANLYTAFLYSYICQQINNIFEFSNKIQVSLTFFTKKFNL